MMASNISVKRRDIRITKGDYGHWSVEVQNPDGSVESYGWWPKRPFVRQPGEE